MSLLNEDIFVLWCEKAFVSSLGDDLRFVPLKSKLEVSRWLHFNEILQME